MLRRGADKEVEGKVDLLLYDAGPEDPVPAPKVPSISSFSSPDIYDPSCSVLTMVVSSLLVSQSRGWPHHQASQYL